MRPQESETVGAITVAAYEPFLLGPADEYRHRLADVARRDREAEVWVAVDEVDGTVLGNVTLCPAGSPWREISTEVEGEFRMLAVAPDAQGRGVGRSLVAHALERFRTEGSSAVAICSLDAMTTAHRLYETLGFGRIPERDWSPLPEVSLIAFLKELT